MFLHASAYEYATHEQAIYKRTGQKYWMWKYHFPSMIFITRWNKIPHWCWRQRSLFCPTNKNDTVCPVHSRTRTKREREGGKRGGLGRAKKRTKRERIRALNSHMINGHLTWEDTPTIQGKTIIFSLFK